MGDREARQQSRLVRQLEKLGAELILGTTLTVAWRQQAEDIFMVGQRSDSPGP